MTEFAARISRVRMKEGASVTILPVTPPESPKGLASTAHRHVSNIDAMSAPGEVLDGFLVVGFYSNGTTALGYHMLERIPRCLMPAYVTEIVRRDVVTDHEAETVFDRKFEWVEG